MKKKAAEKMVSVPESVLREVFNQERDGQISCNCHLGSSAMASLKRAAGIGDERDYISLHVSIKDGVDYSPGEDPDSASTYIVKVYGKNGGELLFEGEPEYVVETY